MSENITTINAGGGIMVDIIETTTTTKKPTRTEAQKQARREKAAAAKRQVEDDQFVVVVAAFAELSLEQVATPNKGAVPAVDVEVVEELADGTVVHSGPSAFVKEPDILLCPQSAEYPGVWPKPTVSTIDFATLGMSVALADLAEARGMNVSDVLTLPERLTEAGLPIIIPHSVAARATKMQRDVADGMLWRNNPTARSLAIRLVNGESPIEILAVAAKRVATIEPKQVAAVAVESDSTPAAAPAATKREPKTQVKRNSAFGHAGVAIARWLGKNDVSLKDAVAALARVGITHLSEGTIKVNLCGGKAGRYGGAPELTQEQINQLLGK